MHLLHPVSGFRVIAGSIALHDLCKLADVEHITQSTNIKMILVPMFQPCRETSAIRVVHLNHTAIGNTVQILIAAVDEPHIILGMDGSSDAPLTDAGIRDVVEDSHAFQLNSPAGSSDRLKKEPVPGGRNGISAIGRQILKGNLSLFQRQQGQLVIGGAQRRRCFPANAGIFRYSADKQLRPAHSSAATLKFQRKLTATVGFGEQQDGGVVNLALGTLAVLQPDTPSRNSLSAT